MRICQNNSREKSPRAAAFETFQETLAEVFEQDGISESEFAARWLHRLNDCGNLSINGWYDPPPNGLAVLFARADKPERLAFESLRLPQYWPANEIADWSEGLLYAYCSPVNLNTGELGDFGITLYFGRDATIRQHFIGSYRSTQRVLDSITSEMSSRTLFRLSQRIFRAAHVENTIASMTDTVPLDLGHTLPVLPTSLLGPERELQDEAKHALGTSRQFVSDASDWLLHEVHGFTVEPQLVSSRNPRLPQISYHYTVEVTPEAINIHDECDELLRAYNLVE